MHYLGLLLYFTMKICYHESWYFGRSFVHKYWLLKQISPYLERHFKMEKHKEGILRNGEFPGLIKYVLYMCSVPCSWLLKNTVQQVLEFNLFSSVIYPIWAHNGFDPAAQWRCSKPLTDRDHKPPTLHGRWWCRGNVDQHASKIKPPVKQTHHLQHITDSAVRSFWEMDYNWITTGSPVLDASTTQDESLTLLMKSSIPRSIITTQRKGPNVRHQAGPGWPPKSSLWFLKGGKPSIWATTPGGSTAIQFPEPSEPPNTPTLLRSCQRPTPVVTLVHGTGLWNSSVASAPRTGTFT